MKKHAGIILILVILVYLFVNMASVVTYPNEYKVIKTMGKISRVTTEPGFSFRIPVVQSGNYSLGVNLMLALVRRAASVLGPEYDIEVVEMHHRHKKDAPSGTALMLAKSAASGRGATNEFLYGRHGDIGERPVGEIAIHALRGGSVVGDHTVMFAGELERVELTHKAQDRAAFAAGALKAVAWAKGRAPGIYTMQDVLKVE